MTLVETMCAVFIVGVTAAAVVQMVSTIAVQRRLADRRSLAAEEAANLMLNKVISCLPVVSESGQIEGILSLKDILRFYIEKNGNTDLSVL